MVILIGFAALVLDAGVLFLHRARLQTAVDAAALAAAQDIGFNGNSARDAVTYAGYNGVASSEILTNQSATVFASGDAWTVTANRTVSLSLAPVLGINQATVSASAMAISSQPQAVPGTLVLPYAVWGGNSPMGLSVGTKGIIYRDNQYYNDVVKPQPCGGKNEPPCNPNWQGNSNNFKGFLHKVTDPIQVGDIMTDGGNAFGQEPLSEMCTLLQDGKPGLFPVIGRQSGNGQMSLTVIGFIYLQLDPFKSCGGSNAASTPFTGTVVSGFVPRGRPGGTNPPGLDSVRVLQLWR